MKKNILLKVGTRTETRTRIVPAVYDENGEMLTEERTEEYTVEVPIMEARNVEMTAEEIAALAPTGEESRQMELESLHQFLRDTDYIACKIAEGAATVADYADIIAQRQEARTRINELEAMA